MILDHTLLPHIFYDLWRRVVEVAARCLRQQTGDSEEVGVAARLQRGRRHVVDVAVLTPLAASPDMPLAHQTGSAAAF